MSEDEPVTPVDGPGAESLLYDHLKHLSSLALLALGGMLSLAQDGGETGIDKRVLTVVVVAVGGGGIAALLGIDALIKARVAGRTLPRAVRWYRQASMAGFGLGIGAFLATFLDAIRQAS